jgi:hypothetical protein
VLFGRLTQLGECNPYKVEVAGSSPASPTTKVIDFQIMNFTRIEGGDNTSSISPTDDTVKLFIWKSIVSHCEVRGCSSDG